jgi:hypothetical protein
MKLLANKNVFPLGQIENQSEIIVMEDENYNEKQ